MLQFLLFLLLLIIQMPCVSSLKSLVLLSVIYSSDFLLFFLAPGDCYNSTESIFNT